MADEAPKPEPTSFFTLLVRASSWTIVCDRCSREFSSTAALAGYTDLDMTALISAVDQHHQAHDHADVQQVELDPLDVGNDDDVEPLAGAMGFDEDA